MKKYLINVPVDFDYDTICIIFANSEQEAKDKFLEKHPYVLNIDIYITDLDSINEDTEL